ncbi:hypothetical protein BC938DRAFT_473713 [Jimgerdemannia flammicorona]|uniref:F-box domain-containing protein n=1 Tax=Jimgerdemannia flammicorona TaxID=994334 RepID=A0A433QT67_9FUNG|nr:hypothetical protein BC938DRAFT_473713 [Jimgerdemannia flammicorona]
MCIYTLSNEVLLLIFDILYDQKSLADCSRVCRSWYTLTTPLIWNQIEIEMVETMMTITVDCNAIKFSKFHEWKSLLEFTRDVDIKIYGDDPQEISNVDSILKCLPMDELKHVRILSEIPYLSIYRTIEFFFGANNLISFNLFYLMESPRITLPTFSRSLQYLRIRHIYSTYTPIDNFKSALANVVPRAIDFGYIRFDNSSDLCSLINDRGQHLQSIHLTQCRNCPIDDLIDAISNSCPKLSSISITALDSSRTNRRTICQLIDKCTRLTKISFYDIGGIDDYFLRSCASKAYNLQELRISSDNLAITGDDVNDISAFINLQCLELEGVRQWSKTTTLLERLSEQQNLQYHIYPSINPNTISCWTDMYSMQLSKYLGLIN